MEYFVIIDAFGNESPFNEPATTRQGCLMTPARFNTLKEANREKRSCNIADDLLVYHVKDGKAKLANESNILGNKLVNHLRLS